MNGPRDGYDAALHLLDHQIVDRDGRLLANVDDLELVEDRRGRLMVTAILTGAGALGPRIGGRLGRWMVAGWARLHTAPDPQPGRIDLRQVSDIGSAIRLSHFDDRRQQSLERWLIEHVVGRIPGSGAPAGLPRQTPFQRAEPPEVPGRHRLGDLLGGQVTVDGRPAGHLNDVRLERTDAGLRIAGLVIGDRHAGSLLGYDRRPDQGPWLIRSVVRRLHAHAGYVPWDDVRGIDWPPPGSQQESARVRVARIGPLTSSG